MVGKRSVEWSEAAVRQLDAFYSDILQRFSTREAEAFLDMVQLFEALVSEQPEAFVATRKRKNVRLGLIHRHVTGVYKVEANRVFIVALFDNRSKNRYR